MEIKSTIHRYIAIIAVLIVLVMTVLDVTLVNVALPILADKFSVSDSYTVWVVTAYQLVITMLLLPLASAGEIYGYKRIFLAGVAVFTGGSALCAASGTFGMLVGSRIFQGVGAALVMSVNIALIRIIYPQNILGRGLALNAMVIAIATAAGPTIAGALLSFTSWHWLFIINIPFGFIAFFMGKKYLPLNPVSNVRKKFDMVSAVENMLAFGLVFYSLGNFANKNNVGVSAFILCIGIIIGIIYIRRQFKIERPMLPVDLLRSRLYSLSILTSTCSFIGQNIALITLPFLFLTNCKFSEMTTGLLMTPWPLTTMIVSPIAARFVERHNPGIMASCGMLVFATGCLLLILTSGYGDTELSVAWKMALCGIGFGMFQTPNNIVMINATPIERSGGAGGMQGTARLTGQTLGATVVTIVFALAPGAVNICLSITIALAIVAATFSISRVGFIKNQN